MKEDKKGTEASKYMYKRELVLGTARDDGIGEKREIRDGFWGIVSGSGGSSFTVNITISLLVVNEEQGFEHHPTVIVVGVILLLTSIRR